MDFSLHVGKHECVIWASEGDVWLFEILDGKIFMLLLRVMKQLDSSEN